MFVRCSVACPLHVDDNLCLVDSLPLLRRFHIRRVRIYTPCPHKKRCHWFFSQ